MQTAEVSAYIHAPCERVFEVLSDHEGYVAVPEISSARLLRPGLEERNGRGAVRELRSLGLRFVEEVGSFERPRRFEYRIIESTLPVDHQGGCVELTPRGDGCEVLWRSQYTLHLPWIAGLVEQLLRAQIVDAFTRILLVFKERLESEELRAGREGR